MAAVPRAEPALVAYVALATLPIIWLAVTLPVTVTAVVAEPAAVAYVALATLPIT